MPVLVGAALIYDGTVEKALPAAFYRVSRNDSISRDDLMMILFTSMGSVKSEVPPD